jgi:transcriptional regulator with XRE-family HTH domain
MKETTKATKPSPNHKLRYERERRGWSQQDVADKVGTTPLNVSRWERGINQPGPHFRQQLCQLFEKSLQELGLVAEQTEGDQPVMQAVNISSASTPSEAPASLWNVP